jgi:hypothetical protein
MDSTNDTNNIIEIDYKEIKATKYYSIDEVAEKLNIAPARVNHWIFKLYKLNDYKVFESTDKISQTDLEKIELAESLHEEGKNYEDIINYFKDSSNALINRESNELKKELTEMDNQVISKTVTLEMKRQIDRIMNELKGEFTNSINDSFKEEASKIANASLGAMEKTKNDIDNKIDLLIKENEAHKKEIERLYNNQTNELRLKLEEKQKEIEKIKEENEKKSLLDRIFKR